MRSPFTEQSAEVTQASPISGAQPMLTAAAKAIPKRGVLRTARTIPDGAGSVEGAALRSAGRSARAELRGETVSTRFAQDARMSMSRTRSDATVPLGALDMVPADPFERALVEVDG